MTVRLAPCGRARAGFVDAQGKPLANYWPVLSTLLARPGEPTDQIKLTFSDSLTSAEAVWVGHSDPKHTKDVHTDTRGDAEFPLLIPGAVYRLSRGGDAFRDFRVESGKELDLGKVVITDPVRGPKNPGERAVPKESLQPKRLPAEPPKKK